MAENKKKLTLDDLKVQSFVTTLSDEQQRAIVGGDTMIGDYGCTGASQCGSDTATMCTSMVGCGGTDGMFDCGSYDCATGYRCY